jgi:ankyrin repeat protein
VANDFKDLLSCIVYNGDDRKPRDLSIKNTFGLLHIAAAKPNSKCLNYLVKRRGIDLNEICNKFDHATPLHFAVLANNV